MSFEKSRNLFQVNLQDLWNAVNGNLCSFEIEKALRKSDAEKIQIITKKFQALYRDFYLTDIQPLHQLTKGEGQTLVQELLGVALTHEDVLVRSCVCAMLNSLEKVDPFITRINRQIFIMSNPCLPREERVKAQQLLSRYSKSSLEPFQVSLPVTPSQSKGKPCEILETEIQQALMTPTPKMGKKQERHDDFWRIVRIFASAKPDSGRLQNLEDIGMRELIPVISSFELFSFDWVRDVFLMTQDEILIPSRICYDPAFKEAVYQITKTTELIGEVGKDEATKTILEGQYFVNQREVPFYFEGGNLVAAINTKGDLLYLSGSNNLLYSLLNASVTFLGREEALLKKMQSLEHTSLFSENAVLEVYQKLKRAGILKAFTQDEGLWIAKLNIAGAELIKEMMGNACGAPVLVLGGIFDGQSVFHIDVFLGIAPNGKIFIQDFKLCIALLKWIVKNKPLTAQEKESVKTYLHVAQKMDALIGKDLEKIRKRLKRANFNVVPAPGVFYKSEHKFSVNFLNSLFGYGEKGTFCITNGSIDPVDRYLREAFVDLMKAHGIENVYYTGRLSEGPLPASGSFNYLDSHVEAELSGGVHCVTQAVRRFFTIKDPHQEPAIDEGTPYVQPESIHVALPKFYKKMLDLAKGT
jgi:hypothetical protein